MGRKILLRKWNSKAVTGRLRRSSQGRWDRRFRKKTSVYKGPEMNGMRRDQKGSTAKM